MTDEPPSERPAVDDVLAALGDPRRRQLLDLLAVEGGATATTLAASLPITRQAIVKHLGVLEAAALVTSGRVGREVRYSVRAEALHAAAEWMNDRATFWDRRLSLIKRAAEEGEGTSS